MYDQVTFINECKIKLMELLEVRFISNLNSFRADTQMKVAEELLLDFFIWSDNHTPESSILVSQSDGNHPDYRSFALTSTNRHHQSFLLYLLRHAFRSN